MIDLIGAEDGKIVLVDSGGDEFASDNATSLANFALTKGGFAQSTFARSSFHFATEYGFETQEDAEYLFYKTCKLV